MQKTTHIQARREQTYSTREAVCGLLGWSEEQHFDRVFDNGVEYLKLYFEK